MANILVVDDAADICTLLKMALEKDGHRVTTLCSASALTGDLCHRADLILLDVMLPDEDGFSLCARMRAQTDCPILFLTALDAEESIVEGLALGGDDYITKPFQLTQLRARIAAHLRREQRVPVFQLCVGALRFDLAGREVYCKDEKIPFTKSEYTVCETLARHLGLVYTREQLLETAFGYDTNSDCAAITEHIKNIRSKLAAVGCTPIKTVWGIGYKWSPEKPEKA